ncbi:hypothetical protein B0J11DRAFT_47297 [Dendryphion nanum]|uniref:Uncharacterized protein n=1 Tax=Dendryphion nanum TaxID=256645 RepID=A0A9P9IG63_9PLEO|nr:hypothetical protein B0J11DRAFT_47297 [Dendryphion nanum]
MSTAENQQKPQAGIGFLDIHQDHPPLGNSPHDHAHGVDNQNLVVDTTQVAITLVSNSEGFLNTGDETPRGRLKRRRNPSHSPRRASSPSRGHDRDSGSRHKNRHRRLHRASSSSRSVTPPLPVRKSRRRSDAEPDHTLRGRARLRSPSRSRSPILEGEEGEMNRTHRKRSPPPSRHRSESAVGEGARRQRSLPNTYKKDLEKRRRVLQV